MAISSYLTGPCGHCNILFGGLQISSPDTRLVGRAGEFVLVRTSNRLSLGVLEKYRDSGCVVTIGNDRIFDVPNEQVLPIAAIHGPLQRLLSVTKPVFTH